MTWNSFHHRGEILRQAIAIADLRHDGSLPMQAVGVVDVFDDEADLLSALMLKWHTRLMGNIERAMNEQPLDLRATVVQAWLDTAEQMPGVRAILDRLAEDSGEPQLQSLVRRARHREHGSMAVAAGLANHRSEQAARVGARLEAQARANATPAPTIPEEQGGPSVSTSQEPVAAQPSFVERIRAVLAA